MAWKRDWHVEATCEKCGTKKETNVTCRQDEVSHFTWRITYCDKCKEWMKTKKNISPILKAAQHGVHLTGGQAGDQN